MARCEAKEKRVSTGIVNAPGDGRSLKIGIFGGTFNPIHLGHLRSAEEIREAFALDRIYFVPAARPPHRSGDTLVSAAHRFNMVQLAVADNPFFQASAVELDRMGPSYSVDTIRYFRNELDLASLFFVVGLDAFREIHTWKEYASIPGLCHLIVTSRPGVSSPSPEHLLPVALQPALWYDSAHKMYRHTSGHSLVFHEIHGLKISASQVRALLRQRKSIRYLVPSTVAVYIADNALYQPEELA
jgi:nicotinate-nucleotide adenylyltransferase